MSVLDLSQKEGIPSGLVLSNLSPVNASLVRIYDVVLNPVGNPASDAKSFSFNIFSSTDYIDPSNIRMELEVSIKKRDKATNAFVNIGPEDSCSVINNLFSSIWSDVSVHLCKKNISSNQGCYPYKAYFRTVAKYSATATAFKLPYLTNFYLDTPGYHDSFDVKTGKGIVPGIDDSLNKAFNYRRRDMLTNGRIRMFHKLEHIDIASCQKYLLNGCELNLEFTKAATGFVLLYPKDSEDTFTVHIDTIKLHVPFVQVSAGMSLLHSDVLSEGHIFKAPLVKTALYQTTIPKGNFSWVNQNLFSVVPSTIMISLVSNEAMTGAGHRNPLYFQNFNLKTLKCKVGTEHCGRSPYEFDFDNDIYMDGFSSLYEYNRNLDSNHINPIKYEHYGDGNLLIIINMSGIVESVPGTQLIQRKMVSLELTFAEALEESINILVYSECTRLLKISEERVAFLSDY